MARSRLRLATLAVTVALGGFLSPISSTATATGVAADVPRIIDAPDACGRGMLAVRLPTLNAINCFHGGDPARKMPVDVPPGPGKDLLCYGGGTTGDRVQALYVRMDDKPDRSDSVIPAIKSFYAPHVEAAVRDTTRAQGSEFGVRWHMPDCGLSVDVVTIPSEAGKPEPDVFTQAARINDALAQRGYGSSDRKYLTWFDGPSAADNRPGGAPGVCGIASGLAIDTDTPWGLSDTPVANVNNGVVSMYATIFRSPGTRWEAFNCWGTGSTGAGTELHELFHTLGAVQMSAPNSNQHSHCTDGPDIMCYPEFNWPVYQRCPGTLNLLDCNSDDYFSVNPPAGSYLSTHWNTARSSFLGDSPLDQVGVSVRRP